MTRVLVLLLVSVLAVGALAWFVRRVEASMAFFPSAGEDVTPAARGLRFEAVTIPTSDGETLHAWWLPRDDARAAVLYLHGNGGNLSLWMPILTDIWARGYAVFAIDYRGYGRSSGQPSESGLYKDVEAALPAFESRAGHMPRVYWGRSLGTVVAAYAASRRAPHGLILEAGFPNMRSVLEGNPLWFLSWLSGYRFAADEWLRNVTAPGLVLHGDRDSVIRPELGRRLHAALQGPAEFVSIPGGDHNDVQPAAPEIYWRAVERFVDSLGEVR